MEKSIEKIIQEIEENNKKIKKYEQRINREKQTIAKEEATLTQQERRARVHRFCEIGGGIESDSVLGRPITEDDVPSIISFLADQESRGKFLSRWILGHTPEKFSEPEELSEADYE